MENAITVSQLNRYIKLKMDHDTKLDDVYVSGEISNFVNHKSGHFYFSLKDDAAVVKAVMFSQFSSKVRFLPENGQKVVLRGQVSVFERDGIYQIYVKEIIPDGAGALALAYQQLKEKLSKEGLFDESHKKRIPQFPTKIGIITSPTGAALQDMLNILYRRFPACELFLCPASVQGDGAAKSLVEAIEYLNNKYPVDLILLGRGGGSAEDLWCFNDVDLAYAIYNSDIPIISCVGHETDFTISDLVADLRAPTPSAAAELAVPDENSVKYRISELGAMLENAMTNKIKFLNNSLVGYSNRPCLTQSDYYVKVRKEKLELLINNPFLKSPQIILENKANKLNNLEIHLETLIEKQMLLSLTRFSNACASLDALSPLKVLKRGYSVLTKDGQVVLIDQIKVDDKISIRMDGGSLDAVVTQKREVDDLVK